MTPVAVRTTVGHPFVGVGQLLVFMARRDRLRAPLWIVGIVGLVAVSAASIIGLYDSPAGLQEYADLAGTESAMKVVAGPGYGLDAPTLGAVMMNEVLLYSFVSVALMCIFLTVRHTRAEEETNRTELVRSTAVGRHSILAAAVLWITAINAVVCVGLISSLIAFGLGSRGTLAYGTACFGVGLVATGTAALAAQVAGTARAALGGSGIALGVAFVLRAVGDLGTAGVVWLSPLGWAQSIRAFADERWWVLAALILGAVVLLAAALMVAARRDYGSGVLTQRAGPSSAGRLLSTPLGLAARLQRTAVISWTLALAMMGFFYGIVADEADKFLENEAIAEMFAQAGGGSPAEIFLATSVVILGLITSGFTVSSVLRLRGEETGGRAEAVLATPVARRRWLWSHLAVSVLGTLLIMVAAGMAVGLGYGLQVGDLGEILSMSGAAANMVPALLVLSGIAVALIGFRPGWATLSWLAVAVCTVVSFLGEMLDLPQWARNVSPFQHVPAVPAAEFALTPTLVLLVVALVLMAFATMAMDRRDVG